MIKKLLPFVFVLVLVLSSIPITSNAEESSIPYQVPTFVDAEHPEKGMTWETQYCTSCTKLSELSASNGLLTISANGWYLLDKDLKFNAIDVTAGDVKIILADGKTLTTFEKFDTGSGAYRPSIKVKGTLSIYGQENNSGAIDSKAFGHDGISSGTLGATINIYGGHIVARGHSSNTHYSTGIGGRNDVVNIYGGNIKAYGGQSASGIASCGTDNSDTNTHLSIYGGTVYAEGGGILRNGRANYGGPGIGSTNDYLACGIKIYGGDITAKGGEKNTGIGGSVGVTHNINIYGGNVNAIGKDGCSGIGAGAAGSCFGIYIYGGTVNAQGGSDGAGIGGGSEIAVSNINISGGTVTTTGGSKGAGIGSGYKGSVDGITISGGTVVATGGKEAAGIGGSYQSNVKNINIHGGTVNAQGGSDAAGIGGGKNSTAESIAISDGKVNATGGSKGAGIGGGLEMDGSKITISGGTVVATGGKEAAGIGGSTKHKGYNISITGGEVTAKGGEYAAGIGGGKEGAGNDITISGGYVTAQGGAEQGAGIGGGDKATADNITISGGQVSARANNGSAGIGAGRDKNCGKITVTGGVIDAKGGYWAPGIGSGCNAGSGEATITISGAVALIHAVDGGGYPAIGLGPWSKDPAKCSISITGKVFNYDTKTEITDGNYGTSTLLVTNGTIIPQGIKIKEIKINSSVSKEDRAKLESLLSKFNIKASDDLIMLQSQMELVQNILELSDVEVKEILADPNKHIDVSIDFEVTVNTADFSNSSNPYIDYALKPVATAKLYDPNRTIKTKSITLTPEDFAKAKGKLEITMPVPKDCVPTLVRHTSDGGEVYNDFTIDGANCLYNKDTQTVTVYIEHCSHVVSYFKQVVNTGDDSTIVLWIIMFAIASVGSVISVFAKKKKINQ